MAKLNPPYIEGSLPAFYGTVLTVPFTMNQTVSDLNILSFTAKLKTIQSNTLVLCNPQFSSYSKENRAVEFFIANPELLTIGQYYKLQLAYIDTTGTIGYYSTVGIIKYTTEPEVSIIKSNNLIQDCTGVYRQQTTSTANIKDNTEKVKTYQFDLRDNDGTIVETSGELLHNSNNDDVVYESTDSYRFHKELEEGKTYTITYTITTTNGIVKSSPSYSVTKQILMPPDINASLTMDLNYDDGYIQLSLVNNNPAEPFGSGNFVICRASSENGYSEWNDVYRFYLSKSPIEVEDLWKDFTVKQGVSYKYGLQQYNNADQPIYSSRSLATHKRTGKDIIEADFEDAFLFDGKRQLKIRYNPKMTSFKTDLLESKLDTIGSKHPFIFRNGNVSYKEFPISGLISYQMDDNHFFINPLDLGLNEIFDYEKPTLNHYPPIAPGPMPIEENYETVIQYQEAYAEWQNKREKEAKKNQLLGIYKNLLQAYDEEYRPTTTQLVNYNITAERVFKLEVLDWLNNGQPKLFRSPTEGNYVVRLLNTSLAPEDKVGRMLHTFSSTAYEIAEMSFDTLANYNFIQSGNPSIKQYYWESVSLEGVVNYNNLLLHSPAENLIISDCTPGTKFVVGFQDQEPTIIMIGNTGSYNFQGQKVTSIKFLQNDISPKDRELIAQRENYLKIEFEAQKASVVASYEQKRKIIDEAEAFTNEEKTEKKNALDDERDKIIKELTEQYEQNKELASAELFLGSTSGLLTYVYLGKTIYSTFDEIEAVTSENKFYTYPTRPAYTNVMAEINNPDDLKTSFSHFYFIDFERRPMQTVYLPYENNYYTIRRILQDKIETGFFDRVIDNMYYHLLFTPFPEELELSEYVNNVYPYYQKDVEYYTRHNSEFEYERWYHPGDNFNKFVDEQKLLKLIPYEYDEETETYNPVALQYDKPYAPATLDETHTYYRQKVTYILAEDLSAWQNSPKDFDYTQYYVKRAAAGIELQDGGYWRIHNDQVELVEKPTYGIQIWFGDELFELANWRTDFDNYVDDFAMYNLDATGRYVNDKATYHLDHPENITRLEYGDGIIMTCAYQQFIRTYQEERLVQSIKSLKDIYLDDYNNWYNHRTDLNYKDYVSKMQRSYNNLIQALKKELQEEK